MKQKKNKRKKHTGYQFKKHYKNAVKRNLTKELFLLSKKDIDSLGSYRPFLSDNDTLFVKREANISYRLDSDMYIQNGYASASVMLLTLVRLSKDRYIRECYIFPIMFCFRQYLELTMKDSILYLRLKRTIVNSGESNLEGHDLLKLWNNLKMYFDKNDSTIKNVQRIIEELNSVDNNGEVFRYGSSLTKRVLNKNVEMPLIDVDILYDRILQLYGFFEGINIMARNGFDEIINNR